MATSLPVKPVLTAPPTEAPHKRGQYPAEFDNLMQPFVNWVCGKWFPDASATIEYMGEAIQLSQTASADAATAAQAAETATDAADTAVAVMAHMQALYLGPKDAPPAVNNTGGPLVKGSLYLNTVQGAWYWWNGAQWVLGMSDPSALTVQWGNVLGTPTTVEGYGITNAVKNVDFTWANLWNKPSTLSGFGITDAVKNTDFTFAKLLGKPSTIAGFGITDAVTNNPVSLGNVDLNSAAAMKTGFWRVETPINGPAGHNVQYSQLIVSCVADTIVQLIFSYSTNLAYVRAGTITNFMSKSWKPIGNHPVRYVDDNMNYMYDEVNGGLNTINVFRAAGNIAKYLPKYPEDGDKCTIVVANGRADNTLHPAAGSGHQIMGLAEPITLDNSSVTVTFMWVSGGYGWRIV